MEYSFWISLFYIFECVRSQERNYRIVVQKITTSNVDNDIFEKVYVELFQINNRSYLDGSVVFKHPGSDMMVNSVLDFWRPNKQHIRVFDVRFSLCSFFEERHKNKFFNNYSKAIKKFATKEFKCPFEAVSVFLIGVVVNLSASTHRTSHMEWRSCTLMRETFQHSYLWANFGPSLNITWMRMCGLPFRRKDK